MFALLCLPIAATLYGLPLVFGWIAPNRFYGFRDARTLQNPKLWHPANRMAGVHLIVAMALVLALEFSIPILHRGPASHLASLLVQISSLIIANALTTLRVLRLVGRRASPGSLRSR